MKAMAGYYLYRSSALSYSWTYIGAAVSASRRPHAFSDTPAIREAAAGGRRSGATRGRRWEEKRVGFREASEVLRFWTCC
ncbi:hypothetical protein EYF80_042116 [Liparis tanakae]|uniref:Uncharacterized protein n=1 Tax=Liparis tanakae TaxID=230148 RepID=A0A4Z2G470_9TELE|nr:hypothetical protein EYF80_042116 [Liparis tanakae]